MTTDVKVVIEQADRLLADGALEAAEESYSLAFRSCLAADEDTRSEALWALIKLAGKFIALGINERPEELYRYVKVAKGLERSFVFERLAIFHRQKGNAEKAEEYYLGAFESKGRALGFEHADTLAGMQRAAQYLQAQGKSAAILQQIIVTAGGTAEVEAEVSIESVSLQAANEVPPPKTDSDSSEAAKTNERNRPTGGFRVIKPPPPKPAPGPAVPIARGVRTQTTQHTKIPIPGKIPLSGPAKGQSKPLQPPIPGPQQPAAQSPVNRDVPPPIDGGNDSTNTVIETIQNILAGQTPGADFQVRDEDLRLFSAEVPTPEQPDLDKIMMMEDTELDQTVSGAFILPMLIKAKLETPPGQEPPVPVQPVADKVVEPARTISSADRDSIQAAWQECVSCLQERNAELAKRSLASQHTAALIMEIGTLLNECASAIESSLDSGVNADEWSAQTDELDWQVVSRLKSLYVESSESDTDQLCYELALTYGALLRTVILGPCHAHTAASLHQLGFLLSTGAGSTKFVRGAIAVLKLSWLLHHAIYGTNDRSTVVTIKTLAMAYAEAQRPEADLFFRRALALVESTSDFGEVDMLELWSRYARFCQDRGNYRRAAEAYTSQLGLYQSCGHDPESLAQTYQELVLCFERLKLPDLAEQYHERLCDLIERLMYPDYKREVFATKYEACGQVGRAEHLYRQILDRGSSLNQDNARSKLIHLLESTGREEEANQLRGPIDESSGERPHPAEVDQADLCVAYGRVACRQGELDEAKAFFMRGFSIRALSTGVSPTVALDLARGLRELVDAYKKVGKIESAGDCCQTAIKVVETHVGVEHVEAANCQFIMGTIEQERRGSNAITHFSQSYEVRRKLLGREHLDTAASAFQVAVGLSGQDLWRDKEDLFKLAITARQRAFGLCEKTAKQYLRVLSEHYRERCSFRGLDAFAAPEFHKLVDSLNRPVADDSSFIKAALNKTPVREDLPSGLSTREKLQFLSARLDDRKFRLGADHPDTLNSLFKIVEIYEQALETDDDSIWRDLPAVDHLNVGLNLRLFGHHLLSAEDLPRCHRLFSTVLTLTEHILGSEHPDAGLCLMDLAALSAKRQEYQLSEILYKKTIEILEARLGAEHLYLAAACNNLAVVYHKQGKIEQADLLYRRALQTVLTRTRSDSSEKNICLTNLELLKENIRG